MGRGLPGRGIGATRMARRGAETAAGVRRGAPRLAGGLSSPALWRSLHGTSVAFAQQARGFDPTLRLEDLFQALRNVWIGNSLQLLLELPLKLTPGLFAYSMLYPATDNLLDATAISSDAKRAFNFRLGQRLMGARLAPQSESEERVFALVGRIEDEFSREQHPDVWESILAIHRGQIASLRQQSGTLSVDDLVELSVAKGGASVLADACLVKGSVSPEDERFAFRYGVFLQLLDDLQDVDTDLVNGHHTLFTHAARRGLLDGPTTRLARFIDVVLGEERFRDPGLADRADLVRRNCRALLVGVMAEKPHRFSRSLRRLVAGQWPIGFGTMRRLRRRAIRRFEAATQHVRAQHQGVSPLQLLLDPAVQGAPRIA